MSAVWVTRSRTGAVGSVPVVLTEVLQGVRADCLIAQTCIMAGVGLLSTDQDFAAIARHSPLRLCAV